MQCHDIYAYMNHMTQFPPIQQQFKVEKCADNTSIKYTMTLVETNATHQNLASLQLKFSHFMHYHDVKIAKLTAQLQDAMHTMRGYEEYLNHNISYQKLKLEQVANDIVLHTIGELNSAIQHTMTTFQSNMQGKSEAFELELNIIVDYMIQDVHAASEAGHHAMTEQRDHMLHDFKCQLLHEINSLPTSTSVSPHPSTRFPNVTLDPTFKCSPNPFDPTSPSSEQTFSSRPNSSLC